MIRARSRMQAAFGRVGPGVLVAGFLLAGPGLPGAVPSGRTAPDFQEKVSRLLEAFRGEVGIYAKDITSGAMFGHRADDRFPTASVFKLPVMIELFRRAETGETSLDRRVRLPRTGISRHGGGVLKYLHDEPELSLRDYCRLMIVHSDNVATDVIMQSIPPAAITATMGRLGFPNTRVNGNCTTMHYRMFGIEAAEGSPENDERLEALIQAERRVPRAGFADPSPKGNVTTPREMGILFERLHRGDLISPAASAQMLEILQQAVTRRMSASIPAGIPVAHKFGATQAVSADAGIIYRPGKPLVLAIFIHTESRDPRAGSLVADLGKLFVEEFHP